MGVKVEIKSDEHVTNNAAVEIFSWKNTTQEREYWNGIQSKSGSKKKFKKSILCVCVYEFLWEL